MKDTFQQLKGAGHRLALATDCKGGTLSYYRGLIGVDDFLDAIACGEDVEEGKPNAAVVKLAMKKLGSDAAHSFMVGDTPYDAKAARKAEATAVGVVTGGFIMQTLYKAGCRTVLQNVAQLPEWLSTLPVA